MATASNPRYTGGKPPGNQLPSPLCKGELEGVVLLHQTSTDFSDFILFFQKSYGFVENSVNKPATFRGTIVFGNLDILVQSHLHGDRGEPLPQDMETLAEQILKG